MARYIDADEYRKRLDMICGDGYTKQVIDIFIDWFMSIAESTESEDVAPVVHAHWIVEPYRGDLLRYACSNPKCKHYEFHVYKEYRGSNFCPDCGAKMDEKEGQR